MFNSFFLIIFIKWFFYKNLKNIIQYPPNIHTPNIILQISKIDFFSWDKRKGKNQDGSVSSGHTAIQAGQIQHGDDFSEKEEGRQGLLFGQEGWENRRHSEPLSNSGGQIIICQDKRTQTFQGCRWRQMEGICPL